MKCELLKRTAIALFVGGVISTYAMAEDKPIEAAGNSFVKAIDAEITKQTEAVKTELTNSIAEKADKSAVDNINTELDARAKTLKTLQEEKASVKDLNAISENVKEGFNSIQDKVHNLQEALAGDGTEEKPGLIKSVSSAVEELNDNIAKKADQSAVDDINAELDARAKALKTLQEEKASVKDLNAISENVKEGFNSIQDKVHNLQEALAGDGTEEKPGLIKSVSSAVEELNDNIAKKANQADVEANKAEIAKFGAQTNSNAALLLTMAGKVDQNKKDTDEAIAKNASAIVNIRNKQVLQNARLDNHGERIEANEAAIGELAKATDESVKNLGNAVNDLDENLAGTQEAVAENRKDIDANAVAIDKLKETQTYKDLSKVETLVKDKADKTAVEKNVSRITDTRNKQVLQNARLDNHSERITAAEVALDTKADKTELAAKADKTELATKADKNNVYSKSDADQLFALKADNSVVNAHTKRLDHLDNRVNKLDKDLKRGLAAQAALTGLFQPYTVGKVNFTAAVGGYKSQTAVAVGTGYRYNQNIATKAGVAFTQGGVTYNAGVNFEW